MRILDIEEWSPDAESLIQDLHEGTAAIIEHAGTIDAGLRKIEQGHGNIDVVLCTVAPGSSDALAFPERVRVLAGEAQFRCPYIVLLASVPLPLPCAAKCMACQVVYLLRDFHRQIIETVRVLLWKIHTSRPGPTIRVEFRAGHYRFFLCGPASSEEIRTGSQIAQLLLLLLLGIYSVDRLADELGISRVSVKKYMRELRQLIQSMLQKMQLAEPLGGVVWMKRGAGGTICGIRANSVWE